jgi:hypothetical protein
MRRALRFAKVVKTERDDTYGQSGAIHQQGAAVFALIIRVPVLRSVLGTL